MNAVKIETVEKRTLNPDVVQCDGNVIRLEHADRQTTSFELSDAWCPAATAELIERWLASHLKAAGAID